LWPDKDPGVKPVSPVDLSFMEDEPAEPVAVTPPVLNPPKYSIRPPKEK
jgi:hypothetical protein